MPPSSQRAHPIEVPLVADSVDSPTVEYHQGSAVLRFTTDDERVGRVTFENLDSIRISRGEYHPFEPASEDANRFSWVSTISNSAWLRERYEYEKLHYADAYEWGGNVDEMLGFSHYVFRFHDEFVEAIADGIWMELDVSPRSTAFPWWGLGNEEPTEEVQISGVSCMVRRNSSPLSEIERRSALCSQTLFEVRIGSNRHSRSDWSVTRRVRQGIGRSYLQNWLGTTVEVYDGIPSLSDIQPRIEQSLAERRQH